MLNIMSIAVNKRVVVLVGALLAMMAILVLSSVAQNGIFAHPHDPEQMHTGVAEGAEHIHYDENGMDMVRDFDSTDPEGARIEWNVRGVDAADFDISSAGVLTFRESPDFENPTDRGLNLNPADGDTGDANEFTGDGEFAPADNNYQITVSATEMRAGASAPLPAKRTDIALTVIVGNVDDDGELTLQWLQPEVGIVIGTTLTDPDGDTTSPTWTWYTSKAADPEVGNMFHWNVTAVTENSYTPAAADDGKYLWVRVTYTDPQSDTDTKTADAKSENPVRAAVSEGANASPDFEDNTDTRTVPESTAVGANVGLPITATDTDNDIVTYELIEVASPNDADDEFFNIDKASGQITVAQKLDYDAVGARTDGATAGTYMVIVRATDPSGSPDNITVTIKAENVNEDPIVTGQAELKVAEGADDAAYSILPNAPDDQPENSGSRTFTRNEYVFEEPDYLDSIADWQLEGDDAAAFDLSGRFEPRYLQFKKAPDFENPTDANNDNVYEVTLVATDTGPSGAVAGIGKVNVWLTVTNVEEAGKVVFTEGETAYLNEMLVAEVQDPDDHGGDLGEPYEGVHIVTWQWSRSQVDDDPDGNPFMNIVGATTNRYTPIDNDRGYYLRATATYTDPHSDADNPETTEIDERIAEDSLKTEMETTENVVRLAPGPASVPTFDETGTVTREVAENTAPGGNVGDPVAAMGPTGLVYSLDGSDAKYFNIDDMGQITVGGDDTRTEDTIESGTDPELDYDDPMKKQRFSVTVKVAVMGGAANQKAEVQVDIIVTDVDELPEITDVSGDPAMTAVDYPEIDEDGAPNTAAIATYVGTDPEGDTISWDLRGADAALFTIPGGVLQFRAAPDYENPKDKDGEFTATPTYTDENDAQQDVDADDGIYNVVIRAIASRNSGDTGPAETVDTPVTVTVTDVDEDGEVVISLLQPEANQAITASLTDPDGPDGTDPPTTTAITPTSWVWEVSEVAANVLDINEDDHWGTAPGGGANSGEYTPADSDVGKYLRVTAEYTDNDNDDDDTNTTKTARMMSANPVQAEGLGAKNESPDFEGEKVERSVAETAEVGDDVPGPVEAAVRARSDTDILTYGLRAFTADDVGSTGLTFSDVVNPAADLADFNIDKATGQITVAKKLDFESRGDPDDGKYVVVATVTDPSGLPDSIVVVITAEDRNENPVLRGRPELTINEINGGDENAANPLFVGADTDATVNVYNVDDEDDRASVKSWRLEGEDKDQFQLIGTVGRTLVFTTQPDYETPADADGDNVYKVTVVAIDNDDARGEFDVCIAVMNINEDGKITLRDEDGNELVQPHAQGPITADLTDPDGGVTGVTWQWERSQLNPPFTHDAIDFTDPMSATYTPTNDDRSYFLKVTATYMDAKNDAEDTDDRMADETAPHAVLEVEDKMRAPEFSDETAIRSVAENAPSTTFVGDHLPVAVDPDDKEGVGLTYTLEDSDNGNEDTDFFELLSTDSGPDDIAYTDDDVYSTQIRVKLHDEAHDLDHEGEDRNGMYEVVLKVTDNGFEDTITVTIMVTDRNEAPSTPAEAEEGAPATPVNNAPEFAAATDTRTVAENTAAGEDIGAPVAATDADDDTLTYSLSGDDMASFTIDAGTGQLMTSAALDFETQASYTVEVTASDGTDTATVDVTIMVTDLDEDTALVRYDADNDGSISRPELVAAIRDLLFPADPANPAVTRAEVLDLIRTHLFGS